jgi:hypothetical protein
VAAWLASAAPRCRGLHVRCVTSWKGRVHCSKPPVRWQQRAWCVLPLSACGRVCALVGDGPRAYVVCRCTAAAVRQSRSQCAVHRPCRAPCVQSCACQLQGVASLPLLAQLFLTTARAWSAVTCCDMLRCAVPCARAPSPPAVCLCMCTWSMSRVTTHHSSAHVLCSTLAPLSFRSDHGAWRNNSVGECSKRIRCRHAIALPHSQFPGSGQSMTAKRSRAHAPQVRDTCVRDITRMLPGSTEDHTCTMHAHDMFAPPCLIFWLPCPGWRPSTAGQRGRAEWAAQQQQQR